MIQRGVEISKFYYIMIALIEIKVYGINLINIR